jgi:hypothetical protein
VFVLVGASGAAAGEITSEGFRNDTAGGTYVTLGFFPYFGTQLLAFDTTEQGTTTIGSGYQEVPVQQNVQDRRPGQCSQGASRGEWMCALATAPNGSPFVIRGHAGDDTITESGCNHTGMPDMLALWPNGSVCPRTFQYVMGDGNDIVRISTPDLTPNRLPSEVNDPVYTFTMRDTLMDGGAGNDQLLVTDGPIWGTARMGSGSDYVNTAMSTGSWTVSCGEDIDAVRTGADDVVESDCERVNGNSRPRAFPDRMRANKSRSRLVVRPLANDRDGGTSGYEESDDEDSEGAPIRLDRLTAGAKCGKTTYRKAVLRFIPPRKGCSRPQRISYVITDGLLVSNPATIRLPAVKALRRR